MQLLDFISLTNLEKKSEIERVKLLCFYHYKETSELSFTMASIRDILKKCGYTPNMSRLKSKMITGTSKFFHQEKNGNFVFIPMNLQILDKEYTKFWENTETIESSSELIDEIKFCNKRQYIDKLIKQINCSYSNNCYDACAVLMRRLFEVLLILSYQALGIDEDIKNQNDSGYIMLDGIVKNAKSNTILKLSRIKNEFDTFRKVGNFSAHNITYTAGKKDIDDIKIDYRVMLEELFTKSNLI
ncbi:hypothetical protein [Enterococcus wangshanyuanii]|uniref:DUF4145 domain-containing protein n=1 Tax=Enterococcus wangshanyuanii TaxID=2005703 RepID=A0ABQ1P7G1_9ENTE|nr:hypothetical protein [Enterococcus wangshanyuanii]GGC92621.1 hypothetical protein GCM10011573_22780 [Enterococcus wangshanyuanii]